MGRGQGLLPHLPASSSNTCAQTRGAAAAPGLSPPHGVQGSWRWLRPLGPALGGGAGAGWGGAGGEGRGAERWLSRALSLRSPGPGAGRRLCGDCHQRSQPRNGRSQPPPPTPCRTVLECVSCFTCQRRQSPTGTVCVRVRVPERVPAPDAAREGAEVSRLERGGGAGGAASAGSAGAVSVGGLFGTSMATQAAVSPPPPGPARPGVFPRPRLWGAGVEAGGGQALGLLRTLGPRKGRCVLCGEKCPVAFYGKEVAVFGGPGVRVVSKGLCARVGSGASSGGCEWRDGAGPGPPTGCGGSSREDRGPWRCPSGDSDPSLQSVAAALTWPCLLPATLCGRRLLRPGHRGEDRGPAGTVLSGSRGGRVPGCTPHPRELPCRRSGPRVGLWRGRRDGAGGTGALGGEGGGPRRRGEDAGPSKGAPGQAPRLHRPRWLGLSQAARRGRAPRAGLSGAPGDRPVDFSITGQPPTPSHPPRPRRGGCPWLPPPVLGEEGAGHVRPERMAAWRSRRTGRDLLGSSLPSTARLYPSGQVRPFVGLVSQGGRRCWWRTQGRLLCLKRPAWPGAGGRVAWVAEGMRSPRPTAVRSRGLLEV